MKRSLKAYMLSGVAAACLLASSPIVAQETSSSIRGQVIDQSGQALAGVTVQVTHVPSGSVRTFETNNQGVFYARGLRVGGPYIVKLADGSEYRANTVEGLELLLGQVASVSLIAGMGDIEEISVTARAIVADVAPGPNATFNLTDLENAPAINRDIKDVVRMDPRVFIDESNSDAIQCVGGNPRFNSLTVDGVGLNDNFGLNSNGYPTERVPFSFDAIQQVAVEMAPFDVEYGAFTGCNINAVTKSGTNDFHGGAFFDYTNDSLRGETVDGVKYDNGDYSQKRYGAHLGGPIIEDKLFFFASYEKLEGAQLFNRRPSESTVTQAELDQIAEIAQRVYGYEVGAIVPSLPVEDEKILAKIDWNINDQHRLALVYNYNDGFSIAESDGDNNEFEFSKHYYERGSKLKAYSGQLFSDWTDNFSTEVRVSYTDLDGRQNSRANGEFGEVRITTANDIDVYLGNDDSRQANDMYYKIWNYKAAGNYQLDDHAITFGLERAELEVYNLFVQHTLGEYRFDSIADFEAGIPDRVYYGNAGGTNNPIDAAGTIAYNINTVYLQDEYTFPSGDLTVTAGLRYDWYSSNALPRENPAFVARNGFSNATNLDGEDLVLPRFAFRWDANETLQVRGGIGLYSGGNPNVWLTNNYQQDGFTQIQVNYRDYSEDFTLFDEATANGGTPIKDVPLRGVEDVAAGSSNTGVNAMDPNFKIPTQLKVALGATWEFDAGEFGDGYVLQADILYSKMRNPATIIDTTLVEVGTAPDGRPTFFSLNKADADCAADPGSNPFGCNRWFNSDYVLTNTKGGSSKVFSVSLAKTHEDLGINWNVGYAYTDAKDVNPMTSSVAFSNYAGVAVSNPNNPGSGTTNWEIKHRFTANVSWAKEFWDDNETRVSMFASLQSGRPYSFTFSDMGGAFNGGLSEFGDAVDDRHLLYVPTGADDPLVTFADGFDTNAFFAYLNEQGLMDYAGQIAPRNGHRSDWWGKIDLRLSQEIPAPFEGHKMNAYMVIKNLTNLIDSDWGVMKHAGYFGHINVVEAEIEGGKYVYSDFNARDPQTIQLAPSKWEILLGVNYKF
ncbi:Oar protein [Kordiimonas sediminis]|uniref:Oar protein n=2 Tax=Kordiimonas sediminis TaxID=1735581 RepID=A0A919AQW9_9PROT|nr:Oar protein [Kordiimonas sediminis]